MPVGLRSGRFRLAESRPIQTNESRADSLPSRMHPQGEWNACAPASELRTRSIPSPNPLRETSARPRWKSSPVLHADETAPVLLARHCEFLRYRLPTADHEVSSRTIAGASPTGPGAGPTM